MPIDLKKAEEAGASKEQLIRILSESYPDYGIKEAYDAGASLDQIQRIITTGSTSPSAIGKNIEKAANIINLPFDLAAYAGAKLTDATGGKAPLETGQPALIKSSDNKYGKLTRPGDIENIMNLKGGPSISTYAERGGMNPTIAKIVGTATELLSPIDAITALGATSKGAKLVGKGIYRLGANPVQSMLNPKSNIADKLMGRNLKTDFADMMYKENIWGRPSSWVDGLEKMAKNRGERIGDITDEAAKAGKTLDITGMPKNKKYQELILETKRAKAPIPDQAWVAPEMESSLNIDKFIKDIGLDDPTKANLGIANKWKQELYGQALSNDPKSFEGALARAIGAKKAGSESVAKIQKKLALDIRDGISKSLNDLKPGIGDEYLKLNKDLSDIYTVKKPLDSLAGKSGALVTEYDPVLLAKFPQLLLAKKAVRAFKSTSMNTGLGLLGKGTDDLITGSKAAKTLLFNPYATGIRNFGRTDYLEDVNYDEDFASKFVKSRVLTK